MDYQFQIQCDLGAFRSNNEDAILFGIKTEDKTSVNPKKLAWMVIADGIGGHNAGEVASEIFTKHFESVITATEASKTTDWQEWIIEEFKIANLKIFEQSKLKLTQKGMGTTGVVTILTEDVVYVGWVGDSRCYWYGANDELQNELKQITKDHTMVQLFVDKGAMTQEEADKANNKNMLSRAIGIKANIEVDTVQHPLHKDDVLLLSTDGLHDSLTDSQLIDFLTKARNGDPIETQMLKDAITAGSRDNITFGSIALI
ncbi:MAG: serine/threonine protein phosphatase PrpC [Polaribacter sp.]|jgi:serine/threonine protein phosphatase PrpC